MTRDQFKKAMQAALGDHLKTGAKVRIPAGGDLLWQWFNDLSRSRSWHSAGPNPISPADIQADLAISGMPFSHWHIQVIRAMDDTFVDAFHEKRAAIPDGVATLPRASNKPITAGMFDAMFG